MTGIMLAARIGAAFTAELGTMTVSEEVEAIDAMGIGPLRFLVGPRLTAIVALHPCLVVVSNIAALTGAYLVSTTSLDIAGSYFFDLVREGLAGQGRGRRGSSRACFSGSSSGWWRATGG